MIRLLNENEINCLIKIGEEYDSNFANKYINKDDIVYIYEKDSEIIAFIIIERTIDEDSIILLYVSTGYRRQKIASKLLDKFFNSIDKTRRIILEVSNVNEPAISLYKKYGFEIINVRKKYYQDGSDAYLMEKRVNNE